MKAIRIGGIIIIIGLTLSVVQNFYFGWNLKPMTPLEVDTDNLIKRIVWLGVVIYLIPLVDIYRNAVKNLKK